MKICAAKIHGEMTKRKMRSDETYRAYLIRIMELGSRGSLSNDDVIYHTIRGVKGTEATKAVLYGAKTLEDLRNRFDNYAEL